MSATFAVAACSILFTLKEVKEGDPGIGGAFGFLIIVRLTTRAFCAGELSLTVIIIIFIPSSPFALRNGVTEPLKAPLVRVKVPEPPRLLTQVALFIPAGELATPLIGTVALLVVKVQPLN